MIIDNVGLCKRKTMNHISHYVKNIIIKQNRLVKRLVNPTKPDIHLHPLTPQHPHPQLALEPHIPTQKLGLPTRTLP